MAVKLPIYMDNHSTTPLDPRVLDRMLPYFKDDFGNAASRNHPFGWKAEEAVEKARGEVAALIGATDKEIVWTSGATESTNLALKGVADFYKDKGDHLITVATEHKATLDAMKRLERNGYRVTVLPVGPDGRLDLGQLEAAITDKTLVVSVMAANNEIGVLQPLTEIGAICKKHGVLFHTDAVQAAGKLELDVQAMNIDLMSLSAHKVYGPKGVGALYVRRKPRVRLTSIIDGGGHERGMRSGTLNVPGIVGMGAAFDIARQEMAEENARVAALRDRLWTGLKQKLDMLYVNGSETHRLPNNLNVSFAHVEGEALMMAIKDVAVSSGSACTSASLEPSYVLRALGVEEELAHTSIRFGLGRFNTQEEVDYVIDLMVEKVNKLREMSPLYEMAKEGIDLKSIEWAAH